jgi:aspartate aminotransferase
MMQTPLQQSASTIAPELRRLLEPLERFEAIRRRSVRLGDRLCDLSYANPYGGAQRAAREAIRRALDDERLLDLQYTPFGGQTIGRRLVADALRERYGLPFDYRHVVLTPGAMGALQLALRTAGGPGDEVVIPVPCWLDYPLYALAVDRVPVTVPLAPRDFDLDIDAIVAAMSERTCAVLLSHPANPTGRAYGAGTLAALSDALHDAQARVQREVTLIADETHRDFGPEEGYVSACTGYARTVLVYSFGKYHFIQGQRLGYVACSPSHPDAAAVAADLVRWTRITGLATPTSLMQRAIPGLLPLRYDQSWLERWRARLTRELTRHGYDVVPADATLFLYVRTPAGWDDFDFAERLAAAGVLVLPAPVFHHAGYFRLALTGSEEMLERALDVLEEHAHP